MLARPAEMEWAASTDEGFLLRLGEWHGGGCDAEVGGGGLEGTVFAAWRRQAWGPLASTDKAAVLALMAGATGTGNASWAREG